MRKLWLVLATLCVLFPPSRHISAATDDDTKKAFLKAREEKLAKANAGSKSTPKPKPKAKKTSPTSSAKPKTSAASSAKKSATPATKPAAGKSPSAKPKPKTTATSSAKTTPAKKKTSPTPAASPLKQKARDPEPEPAEKTPTPRPASTPRATPSPTPAPRATPATNDAPVVIEKSGLDETTGLEPPPEQPAKRHWWQLGSTSNVQYKYLTRPVRDAIDRARVARHRWRYIVVHNSGTRQGNAKVFDYYHRHTRKMPNGLAYHFVIGNGSSSGNGQVEIGSRWTRQINGGHVHSDYLNNIALGICLVGDFNRTEPSVQQREALEELTRYLRDRVGKIDRKQAIVKAHREINPPQWPTDCPGDRFPYAWLHSKFD